MSFKFPTWEEFSAVNDKCLAEKKYSGHSISIPAIHNLHVSIDCQNENCLWQNAENVIRFAWCTHNGFAIYSQKYVYCEAGYLMGCADLINAAHQFQHFFEGFKNETVHDIQRRINKYEQEHPEMPDGQDEPAEGENDER